MSHWPAEGLWKRWLDPLVHANFWVGFGAFAMADATLICLDLPRATAAPIFVFFLTVFTYNFQRLFKSRGVELQSHSARHLWIARHNERLRMLMLIMLFGAVICSAFMNWKSFVFLAPFGLFSIFYSIRVIPGSKRKLGFRDVPFIKIFLIVLTWIGVTVLLPIVDMDLEFWNDETKEIALHRGLFIFAITIPFDIRDVNRDAPNKRTIAQVLGQAGARWFSILLMLAFCLLVWQSGLYSDNVRYALALSGILSAALLSLSRSDRTERFFTFLVEGTMVLQWLLVLLLT